MPIYNQILEWRYLSEMVKCDSYVTAKQDYHSYDLIFGDTLLLVNIFSIVDE